MLTVNSGPAFAAKQTLSMPEPLDLLEQASTMRGLTTVVNKCIPNDVAKTWGGASDGGTAHDRAGVLSDAIHDTGPWLEKYIVGKAEDGRIRCNEENGALMDKFSSAIGRKLEEVLCNAENLSYPGLINLFLTYDDTSVESSQGSQKTNCQRFGVNGGAHAVYFQSNNFNGGASYTFNGQSYTNGKDYVRLLYNKWVNNDSGNSYIPGYGSSTQSQLGYAKYYIYYKDYFTQCGNHKLNGSNTTGGVEIISISKKGVVTKAFYEPQNTYTAATIEGEMTATCQNLGNRIKENYQAYRNKLKEIYKNECNKAATEAWKFKYFQAEVITSSKKEAQVVTPEGKYTATAWETQKKRIAKSKLSSWESKGLVWKNYTETKDGKGNTKNEVKKFDSSTIKKAEQTITDYKKHNGQYFKDQGEEDGFICYAPEGYSVEGEATDSSETDTDETSDACYDAGIDSMSWIVCPAVDNTSKVVGAMEGKLKEWLQIKTNDTFQDQTYEAWNVFRTIANSILVIIFLAIIFSQLTGVGIDNYGIKKMLPRLIVMAILINLSYVICEIAVDLSNILGVGLTNLFKSLGQTINSNGADLTVQTIVANVLGLIGAGGVVAGVAASAASGGGVMIVISLLLALLVALVAVLMFFVMLGARMIIVIIFTILSPVAFALYILPNTQIVFKKWWKVFQAALVVFPICGALFGGSFIIKAIVISGNGKNIEFIPGLIAVVAPFLPFLLLPTLLKNALAGLGALGGTLSTLGNGLKKGAQGGNKALQHKAENSDSLRRLNNFTGRHSFSKKRRARAVADTAAFTKERAERDRLSDKEYMRNRIDSIAATEEAKAMDEATAQKLSLMQSRGITMKGGTKRAFTLDNAADRMKELEKKARDESLSSEDKLEVAALARGMVSMKGGGSKLGDIIRNSSGVSVGEGGKISSGFMDAMGGIYSRDSAVRDKLNEKDAGAGAFTEKFIPNGDKYAGNFSDYQSSPDYGTDTAKRTQTYSAGLNQGGTAMKEYVAKLRKEDIQRIVDDSSLMSSLDEDARKEVSDRAKDLKVTTSQAAAQENQQRVADAVNEINDRLRADRQSSSSEPRGDGADGYGEELN